MVAFGYAPGAYAVAGAGTALANGLILVGNGSGVAAPVNPFRGCDHDQRRGNSNRGRESDRNHASIGNGIETLVLFQELCHLARFKFGPLREAHEGCSLGK